jgi:hypothetical protein
LKSCDVVVEVVVDVDAVTEKDVVIALVIQCLYGDQYKYMNKSLINKPKSRNQVKKSTLLGT